MTKIDYKQLKHSDNGMPTWDAFLGPLLQMAKTKDVWNGRELIQATLDEIALPKALANLRYTSKYHDLVAPNRVNWALSDLTSSGLLNRPRRGMYQITDLGQKALNKYGLKITREFVHSLPKYIEHEKQIRAKNNNQDQSEVDDNETLELTQKQIGDWFDKQNDNLSEKLLAKLRKVDPYKFENMMVTLLSKMGYKGADGDAFVTQKSNDGGIDGILNQDALGLNKIYVQVKRYAENENVSRQTISQFDGDLRLQGGEKGVFITTSAFTSGAEEAGKKFNIKLIDGETLTKLMLEYKVGVQVQQSYDLLEIDDDFFEE